MQTPQLKELSLELRFRQGCLVILVIILALSSGVFAVAMIDEEILLSLSEQRRAGWLSWLTIFEVSGVNIALLLLVIYLICEIGKSCWQALDPVAAKISSGTIWFHPTLRKRSVALEEVIKVEHVTPQLKSILHIRTRSRGLISITNVDEQSAKTFADQVNAASVSVSRPGSPVQSPSDPTL